jgi:hypothetical protein
MQQSQFNQVLRIPLYASKVPIVHPTNNCGYTTYFSLRGNPHGAVSRESSFFSLMWEILFPALLLPVLGTVQIYNPRWGWHALIRCPR